jgi:CBS domain-containing protein
MKINDVMTHRASFVGADVSLSEAARVMRMDEVGYLPICDHGRVAGSVTDQDIVIHGLAEGYNPNDTPVRAIMSGEVIAVFDDQDVREVTRLMAENQLQRLPVLNRNGRLVGVVSLGDLAEGRMRLSTEAFREFTDSRQTASAN